MARMPRYLSGYEDAYERNPREATLQWFRDAKYGLFMHYGLYSLLKRHEWVQYKEKIPVAEYAKLADDFTADRFDADAVAAFAADCGMKYVNLTSRHHDSFCLWDTDHSEFKSTHAPAKRDLVAELVAACDRRGLGVILYYSHGRDWRHPHAPNNDEWGGAARPEYDSPEPSYKYGAEHDLGIYVEFVKEQVSELLTRYPTIAGIWLDGIATPASGDYARFRCQELYDRVHELQPHAIVSYKQGLLGTEDFFAPEHKVPTAGDDGRRAGKIVSRPDAPVEVCTTMLRDPSSWGYFEGAGHLDEDGVWQELQRSARAGANLLLNTGPLPDGSLRGSEVDVLRRVGERIAGEGFPAWPQG